MRKRVLIEDVGNGIDATGKHQASLINRLCKLIEARLALKRAAAEALGVTLIVDIEGEPTLHGDKDLLAGILANLIDNALKYAGSPAAIKIQVRETTQAVSIIVQDNGPGIAAQERSKVVQRFYRLSSNRPGSGLGLSIVSAFTHLHDGTLFIEDAQPGLKVRIELPKLLAPIS